MTQSTQDNNGNGMKGTGPGDTNENHDSTDNEMTRMAPTTMRKAKPQQSPQWTMRTTRTTTTKNRTTGTMTRR
jgi:hypothetical protein